ncbi:N-carbamoyl-D-amino-acid hydrolase [Roseomonas sp. CCTCC AB2023176]|uniref:N-carbamoyl-D-amino-acid hydrolase n=1 Tax=Roseomonas sp. CCTCC AB2023176 TaxID=3342640 RepID=UPI0035DAEE03
MSRILRVAAAQMGPNPRDMPRDVILERMIALLDGAAKSGARLVVFPELAFTTFFPRWLIEDEADLSRFYEQRMPGPSVQPLFERARTLGVGFYVGYAELTGSGRRFNSSVIVGPDGEMLLKYRKVHLPGSKEPRPAQRYQQLEKRYFLPGDLGFPVARGPETWHRPVLGMLICNDRRWPEAWRCLGLQGVELVCIGYNSAAYDPNGGNTEDSERRTFHSTLAVQANAYFNSTWAVSVAKAGDEDGSGLIGGSCIVSPDGIVVAQARSLDDEVLMADLDLDAGLQGRAPGKMFDLGLHRRPDQYQRIVDQAGIEAPA